MQCKNSHCTDVSAVTLVIFDRKLSKITKKCNFRHISVNPSGNTHSIGCNSTPTRAYMPYKRNTMQKLALYRRCSRCFSHIRPKLSKITKKCNFRHNLLYYSCIAHVMGCYSSLTYAYIPHAHNVMQKLPLYRRCSRCFSHIRPKIVENHKKCHFRHKRLYYSYITHVMGCYSSLSHAYIPHAHNTMQKLAWYRRCSRYFSYIRLKLSKIAKKCNFRHIFMYHSGNTHAKGCNSTPTRAYMPYTRNTMQKLACTDVEAVALVIFDRKLSKITKKCNFRHISVNPGGTTHSIGCNSTPARAYLPYAHNTMQKLALYRRCSRYFSHIRPKIVENHKKVQFFDTYPCIQAVLRMPRGAIAPQRVHICHLHAIQCKNSHCTDVAAITLVIFNRKLSKIEKGAIFDINFCTTAILCMIWGVIAVKLMHIYHIHTIQCKNSHCTDVEAVTLVICDRKLSKITKKCNF